MLGRSNTRNNIIIVIGCEVPYRTELGSVIILGVLCVDPIRETQQLKFEDGLKPGFFYSMKSIR